MQKKINIKSLFLFLSIHFLADFIGFYWMSTQAELFNVI